MALSDITRYTIISTLTPVHFVVMCKTLPEKKPVCCVYTRLVR